MLHVRHGGDQQAIHLYIREKGLLVGYAHVDTTDVVEGASAELVHLAGPLLRHLGEVAIAKLAARSTGQH